MTVPIEPICFVSLGMLVLDELRLPNGEILHDRIGGSGAYSTIGARIVTSSAESRKVGSFILAGSDFPKEIAGLFQSFGVNLVIDARRDKLSTRGLLEYLDESFGRKFLLRASLYHPILRCTGALTQLKADLCHRKDVSLYNHTTSTRDKRFTTKVAALQVSPSAASSRSCSKRSSKFSATSAGCRDRRGAFRCVGTASRSMHRRPTLRP